MRVLACLFALLLGCSYEYNYYDADDGGVMDMGGYYDELGEWRGTDPNRGVFRSDSKLQGNATLVLAPAPALVPLPPAARFPFLKEDLPAMAQGQVLIDLATRDNQPRVVTLSFGKITTQQIVPAGPFTEVVAALNIGIGGVAYYTEVDVVEGVQYSLAINRLQATLVYRIPFGGGAIPATPPTSDVGVSASSGAIAHGRTPQRTYTHAGTVFTPAVAPGVLDAPWIIPPFAKAFRVVALPANSQLDVNLYTVTGANIVANYPVVAPALQEYPIPSTAYYVGVQNASAVNNVWMYSLIFELAE